jgi:hypothetical protein
MLWVMVLFSWDAESFALCLLGRGDRQAVAGMVLGGLGALIAVAGCAAMPLIHWDLTSRRASCANNLRLLAVALNRYADTPKSFPPARHTPADSLTRA